ncbi:MAG: hypothetical protein ABIQ31_15310 [Ferruginibacter sp.]
MGLIDFILFPLYVLVFHFIFLARRKRIEDPLLKKYHQQGFWLKVFSTLAFTIFSVYISPGDSTGLYYDEGINISRLITHDASNIKWIFSKGADFDQTLLFNQYNEGYFRSESNYFVTRLVTLFSFVSFRNYMVINLIFSMISYSGVWRLYKFFYEQYPHLHKKFAIAILYLPTFIFWSSGILKDPLCTGMLGWMTYAVYCAFYKKESIVKNLLVAISSGYVIAVVKSYILFAYLPFFILYLVLSNLKLIRQTALKIIAVLVLAVMGAVGFYIVSDKLQEELGVLALDKLAESVKTQQTLFISMADAAESSFSLGVDFDGSNLSLIKMAPAALTATFYRPFLWESKKISTLLSSLESLALMIFTVFVFIKVGPFNFIKIIFRDPMVMYCFFFSIVFALFVGATTLNFGTLVRYKIPCMPFYIIAFVLINEINKKRKIAVKEKRKAGLVKEAI